MIQKQGQKIKIQHGFICFHFCQLNSATQKRGLSGCYLTEELFNSPAVIRCTAASLCERQRLWGEKAILCQK